MGATVPNPWRVGPGTVARSVPLQGHFSDTFTAARPQAAKYA
jgi:hypothetical protein